ncbi:MAG TPA: redoxin domain-containing protein [Terriglobia bacterium]|nr:redoxin domain-containing protein [Terriglobia bacterium]
MLRKLILALLLISTAAWAQHPDDVFVGQKAPELKNGDMWINSGPLKLEQLRGKVVLIEFWAFDCPFCSEAMPHVKEWYDKYEKDGLVVIGVHVPRIDYEKEIPKIKEAVTKKGIRYPVVVDNQYEIWSDYLCNTWPSHFIVDQDGIIQLSHSGAERYEDTEKLIQKLLAKKNGK